MSELVAGLMVFGAITVGALVLLPVFMLQKMVSEERNENRYEKMKEVAERQRLNGRKKPKS
ncbi:hypothetical protein HCTV-8_gp79 [Haloarcula virus HCTV-8]|uniref:Uncharacterized protein n=3 Tax=Haloferacalesvirus hv5 TaxID=1273753 RepID=A0AAE8XY89_9CAUD|nr:hypothetical protein HCTV-7_gp81 [Haloarcula phage HCTV-7]UBF20522.1 hypothetical protein HCTV-9_gp81 [Haloarcula phage HCTV-9]UBF20638.1 hypothetical protein HCTV-11_gp81 [Haloarcula phage HCTV-11]UBF20978.1 hypothetical protein HCTV-8_gp79 [Haloarcula virus HCTV-8]UBF21090.1 hypothetical protein HCTV-10_gp79 [Haloarcula virus HCTV-10]